MVPKTKLTDLKDDILGRFMTQELQRTLKKPVKLNLPNEILDGNKNVILAGRIKYYSIFVVEY